MRGLRVLKSSLFITLASILFAFQPALAQAAEGISLQISPLPIELNAQPGSSVSTDLRVRNTGSQTEKLQVRLLAVDEDNNGQVHLTKPTASDPWASWVTFSQTVFNAPPGEWQTIKMTVDVPKSAAFGYYFAVEYLRADAQALQPGKAVANGAVATFILLNADAPGAKRQAEITSFSADKKSYEFLPATFSVKVKNTGNVHVAPHGSIFITKGSKQVDSIPINLAQGNVLPNGSRYFSSSWNNGFPVYEPKFNGQTPVVDKNSKPVGTLKWDFSKANRLRFGHYTAHLVMVYDNGQRDVPMEAYVSFWIVPWRVVIGLLVILIFVGIGLWSTFRKSARFVKHQSGKISKPKKHE